ncbi:MAG: hypothetical protein DRJ40_01180 [Thermoprotei archaeon]|nr:MAG: hypothetical protein DRJ40_01180 [Thermoprotei archaeon]
MSPETYVFRPRRYLEKEDFEKYLQLVRKVATFDASTKHWVFSPEIAAKYFGSSDELLDHLIELRSYVDLDYSTILDLVDLFEDYLDRLKCVIVTREGGLLRLRVHRRYFRDVLSILREVAVVSYYIEVPKVDEVTGEFQGTELVEKRLKLYRVAKVGEEFVTPVGLLHVLRKELQRRGFGTDVKIEVRKFDRDVPMELNFKLYPYQEEVYSKWLEAGCRGTVAIFTRGGKSFIAMKAIYDLKVPTVIFVTTRELAYTWREYLKKYLSIPESYIGYIGEGEFSIRPVTIATYKSAVQHIERLKQVFELAIYDESHHVPAKTFKTVAIHLDSLYRLALSATPERRDMNHELLYRLCGDLLASIDYIQLVRLKVVAPIEVFDTLYARDQSEKLLHLLAVLDKHRNEKIFVFTQYRKTAEKLYTELMKRGYKVALITGETPQSKRALAFKEFISGQVNIIVTTTVLDEGITVPDADVAVIYEGTGEARQMIQRIGRVLGYMPGKTAKVYEIVDLSNTRERNAHLRRRWVRDLYMKPEVRKYVLEEKKLTTQKLMSDYL